MFSLYTAQRNFRRLRLTAILTFTFTFTLTSTYLASRAWVLHTSPLARCVEMSKMCSKAAHYCCVQQPTGTPSYRSILQGRTTSHLRKVSSKALLSAPLLSTTNTVPPGTHAVPCAGLHSPHVHIRTRVAFERIQVAKVAEARGVALTVSADAYR